MNGVEPVVRLMLLCDDVERRTDAPTKVNIVGLVHAIDIPDGAEFPIVIDQLTIYLALTGGRGPARLQIVGVYADTEEVAFQNPEELIVSDQTKPDRKVVFSMEVDGYSEFIDQAVIIASAGSRPVVRLPTNAAILTVEADEITEFTQKAIAPGKPPSEGDKKRESA